MNWQIDINSTQFIYSDRKIYQSLDSLSPTPSPTFVNNSPQPQETINSIIDLSPERSTPPTPKGAKKGRKGSEEVKSLNRGHWSTQQNKKYHWFLEMHYKHFVNRHLRRMDKIFKTMQTFVGTRQAEQCRSHHQKMEKKYHNFITIISNLRNMHYHTLDTHPILDEITSASIYPPDGIASIQELEEQQQASPLPVDYRERKKWSPTPISCPLPELKLELRQECKGQGELQRVQQQKSQQANLHANILDQSNLNIGQLLLYHQKQDNSCLFNSLLANDL